MSVIKSTKTIVLPNREEILVGPDAILYEKLPSREKCSATNISFLIQNKGQDSLLDAAVYLEVFFEFKYLTKADANSPEQLVNPDLDYKESFVTEATYTDPSAPTLATMSLNTNKKNTGILAAWREPMPIIRNSNFIYNGCNLTWQPAITNEVDAIVFDNKFNKNRTSTGLYTDWTLNEREDGSALVAVNGKNFPTSYQNSLMDENRRGRIQKFICDYKAAIAKSTTTGLAEMSVMIPLNFPPFKCGRTDYWYGKMSPTLPFVDNCELDIQFYQQKLNNLAMEYFQEANGGQHYEEWSCSLSEKTEANLHLQWYTLPPSMRLNDVYTIGHWNQEIIHPASSAWTGSPIALDGGKASTQLNSTQTSQYSVRIQQKPDFVCLFASTDKQASMPSFRIQKDRAANPYAEISNVKIILDTDGGAFSKTVQGQTLRELSRANFNAFCTLSDYTFQNYQNFVFLSADQISSMTKVPAGVWANSTLTVEVQYVGAPKDPTVKVTTGTQASLIRDYMVLYTGHESLRVTRDTCEVVRNGMSESSFRTGRGMASYASRL